MLAAYVKKKEKGAKISIQDRCSRPVPRLRTGFSLGIIFEVVDHVVAITQPTPSRRLAFLLSWYVLNKHIFLNHNSQIILDRTLDCA